MIMKRDGANISLWQQTVTNYTAQNNKPEDKIFDVLIVGGGITGITTGLLLQQKGQQCVIAEAYNLCFGTTGGTTAHLNSFFDTSYDQVQSRFGEDNAQLLAQAATQALALFEKHVNEYSIDCDYERKDGYVFAQTKDQEEQLDQMYSASIQAGV